MSDDVDSEQTEPQPPSAEAVARRALVLAVISCRGILELEPERDHARQFWERVAKWWPSVKLEAELEPEEATLMAVPFGQAQPQTLVDASWRSEALVVLGWALQRNALPQHDEQVDPSAIAGELGFLAERTVLDSPRLRTIEELSNYADTAFTIHWRLRDFSLNPRPMDFADFCKTAWFGPLSLEGVRLVDNDLGLGETPIARAPESLVRMALSIARERHQAANWLVDASVPFSETDTST